MCRNIRNGSDKLNKRMKKYLLCGIDKVRNIVFVKYFTNITGIRIHISCNYRNISIAQFFISDKLIYGSGYLCQLLLWITQTIYMNVLWCFFKGMPAFSEKLLLHKAQLLIFCQSVIFIKDNWLLDLYSIKRSHFGEGFHCPFWHVKQLMHAPALKNILTTVYCECDIYFL